MLRMSRLILLIALGFTVFAAAVRETYQVNPGSCDGCAECTFYCPYNALIFDSELGSMRIDQNLCDGCGECYEVCPQSAIYVNDGRSFIVGTVTDATTQFGMRNAIVQADTVSTTSDLFGAYCLTLYEGVYTVSCHADMYESQVVENVSVGADTALAMNFALQPVNSIADQTGIDEPLLIRCYPNPARTRSSVRLSFVQETNGIITIYNLRGQKVRTLLISGRSVWWDTRDQSGKMVPAGIYLYRFNTGYIERNGKILLFD